jgi:uncharacterized protein (DUF1015 family)
MNIKPFKALRPPVALVAAVAAPPYDVLNSDEARTAAAGNPYSFLRVTKSEIDLPAGSNTHTQEVYDKAAENLQQFIKEGILFSEEQPCYYIYELTMEGRKQTGLVCVSSVADYESGKIKKHELTRPEKEKDRIDHMQTIHAQTGNVFLAYNDVPEMNQLVHQIKSLNPEYDFVAVDGITHKIWVVNRLDFIQKITEIFSQRVPATYIADGHHRAASAAKLAVSMPGNPEAQYFLTTVFPAGELAIMDYNRLVKDLNGYTKESFLKRLTQDFEISLSAEPVKPIVLHEFGMYLNSQWYRLHAKPHTWSNDPIGLLDVTVLQEFVLNRILDIKDVRTDSRIDFAGGIRGLSELEKRVESREMAAAFSLYPVTIQQLFSIADSGTVMPPKSTWFEPKLRDGILTHLL